MKIGEAHRTQSSSLYSANTIGALMHPAPIGVADRTRKKTYFAHCARSALPIGGGGHRSANILAHRSPRANSISAQKKKHLQVHRVNRVLGFFSSRPNWDPPPLNRRWVCPPFSTRGDTLAYRRGGGLGPNTRGQTLWYSRYISCTLAKFHIAYWRTEHFGAPCLFSSQSPINWAFQTGNGNTLKKRRRQR